MSVDRLQLWQTYVRVVETGSFSAVARESGSTQPQVSRQVAALEAQLGVRLLRRSTRALSMTGEGERFYVEARRLCEEAAELESRVRGAMEPKGTLRVACPSILSRQKLLPAIPAFLRRSPELQMEFLVDDRYVDLVGEGVDVAIRGGAIDDSNLHARRIASARRVCVASPEYLQRRGVPRHPEDLRQHECLVYTLLRSGPFWEFDSLKVRVAGRVRGNSPEVVLAMALAGFGIAMAPAFLFSDALRSGVLQSVLDDWPMKPTPIHALYQARRQAPLRVRLLVDHLATVFGGDPDLRIAL